jgi:hypothetical protein
MMVKTGGGGGGRVGKTKKLYTEFPEKWPLGRTNKRWQNNFKMDLTEIHMNG